MQHQLTAHFGFSEMDRDLSAWSQIDVEQGEEQLVMDLTAQETDTNYQDFVAGGVLGKHKIYAELGADPYVVQCVKEGYKLVLDSPPPNSFTKNNKSALNAPEFVRSELAKLEQLNCIKKATQVFVFVADGSSLPRRVMLGSHRLLDLGGERGRPEKECRAAHTERCRGRQ